MPEEIVQLSDREQEILEQIVHGATNQQIANNLGISINTVKVHVRNIFGKIGVSSRTEATMYAVRNGLVYVAATSNTTPTWPNEQLPTPDRVETAPDPIAESTTAPLPVPAPQQAVVAPPPAPAQTAPRNDPPTEASGTLVPARIAPEESGVHTLPRRRMFLLGASIAVAIILLGIFVVLFVPGIGQMLGTAAQPTPPPSNPEAGSGGSQAPAISQVRLSWSSLNALPMAQTAAAATSMDGSIFVIGGEAREGATGAVWRYDPGNDTWRSLTSKPTPVSNAQAVVLNGRIYVPGGETTNSTITTTLEVYDPVQGNWSTAAPLPEPRSAYGLVTLEGRMYLFGGWDGSSARDEVYVYDPDTDTWEEETVMPAPRAYGGAVAIDNKIYVMGGENASGVLASSEIYSPARAGEQWTASTAMLPEPRSRFGSGTIANFIILLGGVPDTRPYYYNIRTDTWQTFEEPELLQGGLGTLPAVAQRDTSLFVVNRPDDENFSTSSLFELRLLYTVILPLNP